MKYLGLGSTQRPSHMTKTKIFYPNPKILRARINFPQSPAPYRLPSFLFQNLRSSCTLLTLGNKKKEKENKRKEKKEEEKPQLINCF